MANRTDNFNRADNALTMGTPSDAGSAWSNPGGAVYGIAGNQAYCAGGQANAQVVLESSLADVDVQATVKVFGGSCGLTARASDTNNQLIASFDSSSLHLYRQVSGGFTDLSGSPFSHTPAANDVIKIHCIGNQVSVYLNGTLAIGPVTETLNQTTTTHGLWTYSDSTSRFDDFSITTAGASATTFSAPASPTTVTLGSATVATITPDNPYTGTITGTPSGSASTGLSAITKTFSASATPQTASWTPTVAGTLTITWTNSGSLTNPGTDTVTVNPPALVAGTLAFVSSGPSGISFSAPAGSGGTGSIAQNLQRSTTSGSGFSDLSGLTTTTPKDTTASGGTLYYYRTRYTDSAGTPVTTYSGEVTAQVYGGGSLTGGLVGLYNSSLSGGLGG